MIFESTCQLGHSDRGVKRAVSWPDEIANPAWSLAISAPLKHRGWDKWGDMFKMDRNFFWQGFTRGWRGMHGGEEPRKRRTEGTATLAE